MKWREYLSEVSDVSIDPDRPATAELGPWVTVREGGAAGYLDDTHVMLADLSGDGNNEAVIPLVGGAGVPGTGVLIFAPTAEEPALVGDAAFYGSFGYDTRATIENRELVLRHSVGAGWEPACCWSGHVSRRYRTDGAHLLETSPALEIGNLMAEGHTIDRFYALIGARNYDAAYQLMTLAEQERTRSSLWPTIFGQADQVSVSILSTTRADGLFPFRLVLASGGRFQAWQGGAAMIYNPPTHSWLIELLSLQPENV